MIDAGTVIDGRYRVLLRIGSGGMADVYLAEDQLLGRQVAVKLLHHRFAEDQEFVERFRREASSAAGLSHPNVVQVFDRGEWDGTYYIAMEYLPGRSLKSIVREGPLEPVAAVDVVIQVLRAARFAHRRGIIHRDIKPHNVILDEEGRAKVTDFGIARAGVSDMTMTGSIMGTAQYLSPEQAQGHAVSEASDIYAVGIVLYELLTGSIPFDGETAVSIALKQVAAPPPVPSALNPAVPPELDAVVLRALAKDPRERFADADQFIAALEQVRGVLVADPESVAARRAHVGPALVAPALLAALPTAIEQSHGSAPPTGEAIVADGAGGEPPPDEQRRRRRRRRWWIAAGVILLLAAGIAAALLLSSRSKNVTVPVLTGLAQAEAAARLESDELYSTFGYQTSPTVPVGRVVETAPPAGTSLPKWSTVKVLLSRGPGRVPLPDVNGLSRAEALLLLKKAGFRPRAEEHASATVPAGLVIETVPPAGSELHPNSIVTVLVSSGPAPVRVPNVVGQSLAEARSTLEAQGLKVGTVARKPSSEALDTVLGQSPSGGQLLPGSFVNLTVAAAPTEVPVPDVIGKTQAGALATLGEAGLTAVTNTKKVAERALNGHVISQAPTPGVKVKPGTTVTINVGVYEQSPTQSQSPPSHVTVPSPERPPTTNTPTGPTGPTTAGATPEGVP
jgi:serine/threonine-protein kinase